MADMADKSKSAKPPSEKYKQPQVVHITDVDTQKLSMHIADDSRKCTSKTAGRQALGQE